MQSEHHEPAENSPSFVTRATAGALGGLAGAAIKLVCEAIVPPRTADREAPPGVLAANIVRAVSGRELSVERKKRVALAMHWSCSVTTSVLYSVLIARAPRATPVKGIGFGIAVWAGFHELFLPSVGATPPLRELPLGEQLNELVSHAIFGSTVDYVRGTVVGYAARRNA